MPPKKSKKKVDETPIVGPPSAEKLEEARKVEEKLTNSILHDIVGDLEQNKLKLLVNVKQLKEKLDQQKEDQADIYYYLNKKCDDGYEIIGSLEEQIISEQHARENAEKVYEKRLDELRSKFAGEEIRYMSKIAELEDKLKGLRDFVDRKDEIERTMQSLKSTLDEERGVYSKKIGDLEYRMIIEKETLRKEYEQIIEKMQADIEVMIEGKLSETTKETRNAYNHIVAELSVQVS